MSRNGFLAAAAGAVLLVAAAVLGTLWLLSQPVTDSDSGPTPPGAASGGLGTIAPGTEGVGRIQVTLYVLDRSGRALATETQEIDLEDSVQTQARSVVELLLKRSAAIPEGVELRELFITAQGVAYVDLSRELVANHPGGVSGEQLTVFSLSNTLIANFPVVKMVKILVEGREVQTLAGHLDLTLPYGRAPSYLQPESEQAETRNESL